MLKLIKYFSSYNQDFNHIRKIKILIKINIVHLYKRYLNNPINKKKLLNSSEMLKLDKNNFLVIIKISY